MAIYSFTITIEGTGETPQEAWEDAVAELALSKEPAPNEYSEIDDVEF